MVWLPYTEPPPRREGEGGDPLEGGNRPCTRCRSRSPAHAKIVRLQPGRPTAPEGGRLPLLPSGPDGVHGPSLRGTRLSTSGDLVGGRGSAASTGNSAPL